MELVQPLTGADIGNSARKIVQRGEEVYLAVAYWSGGAAKFLGVTDHANVHVVLDVKSGGTCPDELRMLSEHLGKRLRVLDGLHAKIYASKSEALVGSANASRRGLRFEGQGNHEASLYLEGEEQSEAAYGLAKSFFDQGIAANDYHIRICEERFGKGLVSDQELEKSENLSLHETLIQQPHVLRNVPALITTHEIPDDEVLEHFNNQREELGPSTVGARYDPKRWEIFGWKLNQKYRGKACLAFHVGKRGGLTAVLVRPSLHKDENATFADILPWAEIEGLADLGTGRKTIRKTDPYYERLIKVIREVDEWDEDDTESWFVSCNDLVNRIKEHG